MAKRKPVRKRPLLHLLRLFLIIFFLFIVGAGAAAGAFILSTVRALPALTHIEPQPSLTSTVYASDGSVLANLHGHEHRIPVSLEEIPSQLQHAFIAIEDYRFYSHYGVDLRAIARAAYLNLTEGQRQGGSTITQQLAKNAFLTLDSTYERKLQEAIYAVQLERMYTKDEILEMYLNQVPFGRTAHGVQAAAYAYFRKDVSDLTLAESAFLAALPWSPSLYDRNPDQILRRQAIVLNEMVRHGYIDDNAAQRALSKPLDIQPPPAHDIKLGGHFLDYVLEDLLNRFGSQMVYTGGLQIHTTLDPMMQAAAEEAMAEVLDPVFPMVEDEPILQSAAIILDPQTGHIKAMVGGRSHDGRLSLNRTMSLRQPGSAFKPLAVYVPALDLGFSPGDVIDDAPVTYPQLVGDDWTPKNYDRTFRGLVTLRTALNHSLNVVAAKLMDEVGPKTSLDYLRQLGITSLVTETTDGHTDEGLSLALGALTHGVSPLEMALAFGVLANQGVRVEPNAVTKIVDRDGNVIWEASPRPSIAVSEKTAYMATNMMRTVVTQGTGRAAAIDRPVAGKTGTTDDYRDAWFVGYSTELVGCVWMGYDRELTMASQRITGGSYPARIWNAMMRVAHEGLPASEFPDLRHEPLMEITICAKSGKLPGPDCHHTELITETYLRERRPTETCDVHVRARICSEHPEYLASEHCPSTQEEVFLQRREPYVVGSDGRRPRDAEWEIPTETCPYHLEAPPDEPDTHGEEDESIGN